MIEIGAVKIKDGMITDRFDEFINPGRKLPSKIVELTQITDEMLENEVLKEYIDTGMYDIADIFFLFHLKAYEEFGIDENYWFNYLKDIKIK